MDQKILIGFGLLYGSGCFDWLNRLDISSEDFDIGLGFL